MVARDRNRNRNRMRNRHSGTGREVVKKENKNRCGDIKMKAMARKGGCTTRHTRGVGVCGACLTV